MSHERAWARPRRVLQTLPDLQVGGGPVIALNGIRHLPRSHYRFDVLALEPERAQLVADFEELGVEPVLLEHRPSRALLDVAAITRLIRRRRIDVVHVHGANERRLVMPAALAAGVPVVSHLHSEWVHFGPMPPARPNALTRARAEALGAARDRIEHRATKLYLADSEAAAERFRPHVRSPILTMTQSMPFDLMAEARAAHDDAAWRAALGLGAGPVVVNVSRAVPGKGQDRLIGAFVGVLRRVPDARLLLVGDGELRPEHQRMARELGVEHAVRFLGTRRDIPALLVGADVFAFASHTESFGLVVGEAMTAQLPVVAYRLPSLDTFCGPDVTGFYPEQDDEAAFVDRLCLLLGDRERRRRMGQAAFRAVAARFPIDATARSFDQAYRWVLDHHRPCRRSAAEPLTGTPTPLWDDAPITPHGNGLRDGGTDASHRPDQLGPAALDHVLLPGVERGGDHRADGGRRAGGR
jgi:glycosyltransferase involved in cell wall biosynthesis